MERMLLVSSSMNRKALALTIVLLFVALAPAAAIIGFCTRMACCSHQGAVDVSFGAPSMDCCTAVTCYDAPSVNLKTAPFGASALASAPAIVMAVPFPLRRPVAVRTISDASPPRPARERLAVLATLLI
jgi:hypothetical protein